MSICISVPSQKPTFKCLGDFWLKDALLIKAPLKELGGVLALEYTANNRGVDRGRSWAVTHETYKSAKMKGKKEQKKRVKRSPKEPKF